MVGVPLKPLDLVVIDADRHHVGQDGVKTLRALCAKHGELPPHPWVTTVNNGEHHFFKQPADEKIPTREIGPGLETRGFKSTNDGSYIIASGSQLGDGRRWWRGDGSPSLLESYAAGTIPIAPQWLIDFKKPRAKQNPNPQPKANGSALHGDGSREAAYAAAALDGIAAELASAPAGTRNNALNGAGFRMGTMVSRGWIPRPDVADALWAACESNGLVQDDGADAVQATLASGIRAGEQEPHPDLEDRPRDDFGGTRQSRQEQQQEEPQEGERSEPGPPAIRWHGDIDLQESRPYLVQEIIPEVGIGLASGQWGTFKTFTALDLAHCVMTGEPFIGSEIMRRGGVLFIALEGTDEVAIRLQGVIDHKGKLLDRAPFAWVESCPRLLDKNAADELGTLAKEVADRLRADFDLPLSLITIDTMVAAAGYSKDGQENDAAANQAVMNTLRQVARTAGCFVLAVDHFGKAVETGTRGSSSKEGAADVVLALLGDKSIGGEVTNTRLALRKRRGGANGQEFPFRPRVVDMGVDKYAKPMSTLVIDWGATAEPPATAKADPRWSKSLRLLRQVLMNLLVDQGTEQRIHADGPVLRTVNIEIVRAEFYRCYLADGDTEAKKAEARKKAFKRAVEDAQGRGVIGLWDLGTATVVWLATHETPGSD